MIVLGLTGSIGMGKSTTARMFAEEGVPVWDADAIVHRLYAAGGMGAERIARFLPDAVGPEGVNREKLRAAILRRPEILVEIEAAIHPLVASDRESFIEAARAEGQAVVLCDIPLLFETGAQEWLDRVAVVSAPEEVQRERVLQRPGMSEEALDAILAKQIPDAEKRRRADYVIDTGQGLEHARAAVRRIVSELREEQNA